MIQVSCTTFKEWRTVARQLLSQAIKPSDVSWQHTHQTSLFESPQSELSSKQLQQHKVPEAFIKLAKTVACFREQDSWSRLYCMLWRLVFEDKYLLNKTSDADVQWLRAAEKAVNRDCHKMKAFVRFAKIADNKKGEYYAAWFEPRHLIVERMAPFFRNRFTGMQWSILSPDQCCHWNGSELAFSPGISQPEKIHDELNTLWKTYYASIFNPARVKIKAMQKEMPKLYWKNLPEAELISTLISASSSQLQAMLNAPLEDPNSLREKSTILKQQQNALRAQANRLKN